jgi:hypothetical protein
MATGMIDGGVDRRDGKESRFLLPYLLTALRIVPPSSVLATQAIAVLNAWDGGYFADAVTSTTLAHSKPPYAAIWKSSIWRPLVHHLQVADFKGPKSATHTVTGTACSCVCALVNLDVHRGFSRLTY